MAKCRSYYLLDLPKIAHISFSGEGHLTLNNVYISSMSSIDNNTKIYLYYYLLNKEVLILVSTIEPILLVSSS